MLKVGVDAIGFYTPNYYLDMAVLAEARGVAVNKYRVGLGQEKMAVIPPDEDVVTMAADAGAQALKHIDPSEVDLLLFATESAIDQSKAAGIFVHRLLNLPARCRVVELKQACYGATAGLQMALPLLRENPKRKILLIASDIARYGLNTSGESSQGGGAIAMVLAQNPRILAIEAESGFYTEDVMDFWRPNYREEAIVDGKYSCELYLKLVHKTWEQYAALSRRNFSDHAYFCYHAPVPRLVEKAHQALAKLNGIAPLSQEALEAQLGASLRYGRVVGNCYTAALYLSFLSLLENTQADLAHARIGFYSYGSGCVAEFFSGIVQEGYQKLLEVEQHQNLLNQRIPLLIDQYERFYNFHQALRGQGELAADCKIEDYKKGRYRFAEMRQHKRIYENAKT